MHLFSESHRDALYHSALFNIPLFIIFSLKLSSARNVELYSALLYPQETQERCSMQSRYIENFPQNMDRLSPKGLSANVRKLVMLLKTNNGGTDNLSCPPNSSMLQNKEIKNILQVS